MLQRIESAFGLIPALVIGAGAYAIYHVGYGMEWGTIGFLFFIGLMFAVAFRLTGSIFILWPLFQPSGQLITLLGMEDMSLPPIATLGFFEVLAGMIVLVILVERRRLKSAANAAAPQGARKKGS